MMSGSDEVVLSAVWWGRQPLGGGGFGTETWLTRRQVAIRGKDVCGVVEGAAGAKVQGQEGAGPCETD